MPAADAPNLPLPPRKLAKRESDPWKARTEARENGSEGRNAMAKPLPAGGYSPRSLPDKLGYKPGMAAAFIALPPELSALGTAVDFAEVVEAQGWKGLCSRRFDLIHAFTRSRAEIAAGLAGLERALKRDGMIWVSWPKQAAKIETDVTEDTVRAEALKLDLVDIKVAAVDAIWSGLKLVIRKDRR